MLETERRRLAVPASTVVAVRGSIPEGLHSVADRVAADLLVVGSAHRGPVGRVMLGDDARRTLSGARCAVAIVPRGRVPGELRTIAVGDDGSAESALALHAARGLAQRTGATIRLLAVVGPSSLSYREVSRMDPAAALLERAIAERRRLARRGEAEVEVLEGE